MAEHIRYARNRREFLTDCFCGAGSLAFASMMAESQARAARYNPLAPKPPHMPDKAKAKAFIFVYMAGGPSHLETWDPKPLLNQLNGQKRPAEFGDVKYQNVNSESRILGCKRTFQKYGKSGIEVSDLFPHQAEVVDDLCVVRSMHGDMVVHSAAQYQMMTGRVVPGFPAMGSWVVYGLGSEAESLPAYVVMPDSHGAQEAGLPMYKNGFLPAVYQPTMLRPGNKPVLNLDLPKGVTLAERRKTIDLIRSLNEANLPGEDPEFAARISAYDTAFKMQTEAPEVFDISKEPKETLDLYGVGDAEDGRLWAALPAGAADGGEGRALRLRGVRRRRGGHGVGRAQRHRNQPHQDGVDDGQAGGGADQGLEAARNAGFDDRAVGRRIRPVAGIGEEQGPRPPQYGVLDVGGGRRIQRRHGVRRDGRDRPEGRRRSRSTSAICMPRCCTRWGSIRTR